MSHRPLAILGVLAALLLGFVQLPMGHAPVVPPAFPSPDSITPTPQAYLPMVRNDCGDDCPRLAIQNGQRFLHDQYDPEIGLLRESPPGPPQQLLAGNGQSPGRTRAQDAR